MWLVRYRKRDRHTEEEDAPGEQDDGYHDVNLPTRRRMRCLQTALGSLQSLILSTRYSPRSLSQLGDERRVRFSPGGAVVRFP